MNQKKNGGDTVITLSGFIDIYENFDNLDKLYIIYIRPDHSIETCTYNLGLSNKTREGAIACYGDLIVCSFLIFDDETMLVNLREVEKNDQTE